MEQSENKAIYTMRTTEANRHVKGNHYYAGS